MMLSLTLTSKVASIISRCSSLSISQNFHSNVWSSRWTVPAATSASLSQYRYLHRSPVRFEAKSPAEEGLIKTLAEAFPAATDIAVVDVSGGCGSMYEVYVEAPDFAKMRLVKQHQLVTRALSSQIKDMHGIRISTAASRSGCS